MILVRILKIISLALGVLTIPLIFVGIGVFISPPLLVAAFVLDRIGRPESAQKNKKYLLDIAIVVLGVGIFYGLYATGSFGNIDTTGKPSTTFTAVSLVVCASITAFLLWMVNRSRA